MSEVSESKLNFQAQLNEIKAQWKGGSRRRRYYREIRKIVVAAVAEGISVHEVAKLCGIPDRTIYRWASPGDSTREDKPKDIQFIQVKDLEKDQQQAQGLNFDHTSGGVEIAIGSVLVRITPIQGG